MKEFLVLVTGVDAPDEWQMELTSEPHGSDSNYKVHLAAPGKEAVECPIDDLVSTVSRAISERLVECIKSARSESSERPPTVADIAAQAHLAEHRRLGDLGA